MFRKVLIANRGEIAVRITQACQELGIRAVAVYSEADRDALHVARADEALPIGPPPAALRLLGDKAAAKRLAQRARVPVVPGYQGGAQAPGRLLAGARAVGFPLLIKAVAGGGGGGR